MPISVTMKNGLGVIHARPYGDVNELDLRQSLQSILDLKLALGVTRVLFDANEEPSLPTTLPLYDFGVFLAENGGSLSLAVVTKYHNSSDLRFLVNVARNRGARIRIFDAPEDAVKWLKTSRIVATA